MGGVSIETIAFVGVALIFGFYNGLHDSSNIVAIVISTHAMRPRSALWMAAIAVGVGPLLFGVAVATTIGRDIVESNAVTIPVVFAALLSAITWNMITLTFGIPSSSSHALVGGIVGAVWAGFGLGAIQWNGLLTVVMALLLSPIFGLIAGMVVLRLVYGVTRNATPRINMWFRRGEVLSGGALALAHGTNDAQKTMGIIVLGLVATGQIETFEVPLWVIAISAMAMASGTMLGGWSLIRTLGKKFYRIRPLHGFSAQSASSLVILVAALLGGPASTTHVVSTSIVGAGAAHRVQMVRWGVMANIVLSWVLTIPATASIGAIIYGVITLVS